MEQKNTASSRDNVFLIHLDHSHSSTHTFKHHRHLHVQSFKYLEGKGVKKKKKITKHLKKGNPASSYNRAGRLLPACHGFQTNKQTTTQTATPFSQDRHRHPCISPQQRELKTTKLLKITVKLHSCEAYKKNSKVRQTF